MADSRYSKKRTLYGLHKENTRLFLEVAKGKREKVVITYETREEAYRRANVLCQFRRKHSKDDDIFFTRIARRQNQIFIEKERVNNGREDE